MRAVLLPCATTLACAAALLCTPAHAAPPAIDDFFATEETGTLRLSPSGDAVAFINRNQTPHTVDVIDTKTFAVERSMQLGVDRLSDVEWATDDRLLVKAIVPRDIVYKGYRLASDFPSLQLVAIDRAGGNATIMLNDSEWRGNLNKADLAGVLPGDANHVLMTAGRRGRLRLLKVNINDGTATEVEKGNSQTTSWLVDRQGTPRIRFDAASNGRWFKIRTRAPGSDKWETFAKVRTENVEGTSPIAPTDDPGVWYVSGRRPGDDRSAIWLYDLADGSYLEEVYAHPTADVRSGRTNGKGEFIGVVYDDGRRTYDFNDDRLDAHIKGLSAFFGADTDIMLENVSRDGLTWIIHAEGPQEPGSHFLYDVERTHAEPLGIINAALSRDQLGATESLTYTARDGLTIPAYLTRPAAGTGTLGTAPLIVMPHGGPHLRDYYGFDFMAQFLASRGYAVLQPNFRGSSGFGDAFEAAGHGEWGGAMQDDLADGIAHLVDTGRAHADRVAIVGGSYGGYAAMTGLALQPDLYRCGVSINGISDLVAMLKADEKAMGRSSDVYAEMVKSMGDRKRDRDKLDTRSAIHNVDAIRAPLLLVAGENDTRVLKAQSELMAKALKAAGKPHTFRLYAGANHSLRGLSPQARESETEDDDDYNYANKAMMAEVETFLADCFKN